MRSKRNFIISGDSIFKDVVNNRKPRESNYPFSFDRCVNFILPFIDNVFYYIMDPCSLPIKLWISDILTIPKHSILNNAYIFNGRTVHCIDIMGVVISIEKHESFSILVVDDGTGCIKCKVNKPVNHRSMTTFEEEIALSVYSEQAKQAMNNLLAQTFYKGEIDLGTSVHVVGKIYEFHGNRQIFAVSFNITSNIFDEADRIYEMCDLYSLYCNQTVTSKSNILKSPG